MSKSKKKTNSHHNYGNAIKAGHICRSCQWGVGPFLVQAASDMAGGVIEDASLFDETKMVYKISKVLGIESVQTPESGNSIRNE